LQNQQVLLCCKQTDYGKSNVNRCGTRAKVVGTAFALGANKMSAPIEGNTGYMLLKTYNESSSFKDFLLMWLKLKHSLLEM
jgi:hypothetical protein